MARLCPLQHWFEDGFLYNAMQRLIKEANGDTGAKTWRKSLQKGLKRLSSRRKHSYEFLVPAAHFFKFDDPEAGSTKHALLCVTMQLAENVPFFFNQVREAALKIDLNAVDVLEVFKRFIFVVFPNSGGHRKAVDPVEARYLLDWLRFFLQS